MIVVVRNSVIVEIETADKLYGALVDAEEK